MFKWIHIKYTVISFMQFKNITNKMSNVKFALNLLKEKFGFTSLLVFKTSFKLMEKTFPALYIFISLWWTKCKKRKCARNFAQETDYIPDSIQGPTDFDYFAKYIFQPTCEKYTDVHLIALLFGIREVEVTGEVQW